MIADGAYSIYISGYHSSERRDVAYLPTQSPLGCHESEGPGRRRYSISKPPRYEEKHLSPIQQVTNTLEAERAEVHGSRSPRFGREPAKRIPAHE